MFVLSLGLAMDATAVALARGLSAKSVRPRDVALVALLFGGFQAGMPLIGFVIGDRIGDRIAAWDHWIALVLLGALGGKMIFEGLRGREDEGDDASKRPTEKPFALKVLVVLAVATSVDALIVGFTLPIMGAPLVPALAMIGITTAILSGLGVVLGGKVGERFNGKLDVFGGLVLVGLGVKTFLDHTLFAG